MLGGGNRVAAAGYVVTTLGAYKAAFSAETGTMFGVPDSDTVVVVKASGSFPSNDMKPAVPAQLFVPSISMVLYDVRLDSGLEGSYASGDAPDLQPGAPAVPSDLKSARADYDLRLLGRPILLPIPTE